MPRKSTTFEIDLKLQWQAQKDGKYKEFIQSYKNKILEKFQNAEFEDRIDQDDDEIDMRKGYLTFYYYVEQPSLFPQKISSIINSELPGLSKYTTVIPLKIPEIQIITHPSSTIFPTNLIDIGIVLHFPTLRDRLRDLIKILFNFSKELNGTKYYIFSTNDKSWKELLLYNKAIGLYIDFLPEISKHIEMVNFYSAPYTSILNEPTIVDWAEVCNYSQSDLDTHISALSFSIRLS